MRLHLFACAIIIICFAGNICGQNKSTEIQNLLKIADSLKYNQPANAEKYAVQALQLAQKANDKKNISNANSLLGNIKYHESNFAQALNYFHKALKINEIAKDSSAIAKSYNYIAMVLDDTQRDSAAMDYYFKAAGINKKLKDTESLLRNYNNIGNVYAKFSLIDSSLVYYNMAAQLAESSQPLLEGAIKHNMAMIYIGKKEFTKALGLFFESLKAHKTIKNQMGEASNYLYIGLIYTELKQPEKGYFYLNSAADLCEKNGYKIILSESYLQLAKAYENDKNADKALKYYKLWTEVWQKMYNENSANQISEMQTKYETGKKQQENILLLKQNKINALEISRQQSNRNILIGIFAAVLLLGGVSYNRFRLKQKNTILKEREMRAYAVFNAHEEEKIRLSKELHDGVGPLLSLIKLNISGIETNAANEKLLKNTKQLASESIKEVRNISHSLMPGLLIKAGLQPALEELAEQVNFSGNTQITLNYSFDGKLKPEAEINIYRIIQEAINNILKHAEANKTEISVMETTDIMEVEIMDNGKGFDAQKMVSGNGLNNIYSRVAMLKGTINLQSSENSGTQIHISLPLKMLRNA